MRKDMRRVLVGLSPPPVQMVHSKDLHESVPIFAIKEGIICGMLVREYPSISDPDTGMWILRLGGSKGCCGHYNTRDDCMNAAAIYDYEFYVEPEA